MANFYFAFILLCFVACSAKRDVNDFVSHTWNSVSNWGTVLELMRQGVDVMVIQEAGSMRNIRNQVLNHPITVPMSLDGFDLLQNANHNQRGNVGIKQFDWTDAQFRPRVTYNLTYYDNIPLAVSSGAGRTNSKQNMAIVSRFPVAEFLILSCEFRDGEVPKDYTASHAAENEKNFVNRPVVGIRVANTFFFNVHAEPVDTSNEVPVLINRIERFMRENEPSRTWILMGDFNRVPNAALIPDPGAGRFIQLVRSRQATRHARGGGRGMARELDYGVIGGPGSAPRMAAQLVQLANNPSDHTPVRFEAA